MKINSTCKGKPRAVSVRVYKHERASTLPPTARYTSASQAPAGKMIPSKNRKTHGRSEKPAQLTLKQALQECASVLKQPSFC